MGVIVGGDGGRGCASLVKACSWSLSLSCALVSVQSVDESSLPHVRRPCYLTSQQLALLNSGWWCTTGEDCYVFLIHHIPS